MYAVHEAREVEEAAPSARVQGTSGEEIQVHLPGVPRHVHAARQRAPAPRALARRAARRPAAHRPLPGTQQRCGGDTTAGAHLFIDLLKLFVNLC